MPESEDGMQPENQTAEEQQAIAKACGKLLEPGKDRGANCALELLGGAKHAYSVRPLTFKTLRENSHCIYIYAALWETINISSLPVMLF